MKNMLPRAILACALGSVVWMTGTAWPADTLDGLAGTWVLNVAKSTFDPPPPLKSQTVTISTTSDGGVHQVIDYQEADGPPVHMEFTTAFDGKDAVVTGNGEADAVLATRPKPNTFKYVFKKSGKPVETMVAALSASGKSWTGPIWGKDKDGAWKYHYVFERQ